MKLPDEAKPDFPLDGHAVANLKCNSYGGVGRLLAWTIAAYVSMQSRPIRTIAAVRTVFCVPSGCARGIDEPPGSGVGLPASAKVGDSACHAPRVTHCGEHACVPWQ